ncbi:MULTISPECIES: AIPR family protein [Paenibacillus]|uniref:Abortive phage infection protein C-terminal domain-containing protein n=1 Tax=Paenibacillus borealis TaxID=160799 RepID=A0ABX3HW23_PAEBO|nr:AIPR family protein [Paenibacillus borealis]OMD53690.1 hypothetical protein BSK56_00655 [Paenibacillus borealis]
MGESLLGGYEGMYQTYYQRILEEVEAIKTENDYERKSHAFAHWYLMNIRGLSDDDISEYITDGFNDWGIDAVIIDEAKEIIELYQFKLPDKVSNIDKLIGKDEIETFLRGYKICSSGKAPGNANDELKEKIKEILDSDIFTFKMVFVGYSGGLSETAQIILDGELKYIKDTGNKIYWELFDKERIANVIYSSKKTFEDFEIELKQSGSSTGILTSENSASYTIYCSLEELADICEKHKEIIFDENVRLFHGAGNKFNKGIIETAASPDEVINFQLYNNGIVMVSPNVKYIDTRKKLKIRNPMVVNGCQTMNSLLETKSQGKLLEGYVQVKVIEVNDPQIRQNISIFLNSQTEIKDSYLISNLPIIRQLEIDLSEKGYFLERQANKVQTLKKLLSKKEKANVFGLNQNKTISLELAIQLYATFYENMGPIAKKDKSLLFTNENLSIIFKNINAERVICCFELYQRILEVIKSYRQYIRNSRKRAILEYLSIRGMKEAREYTFLNTADIYLLSLFSQFSQKDVCSFDKIGKIVSNHSEWTFQVNEKFDEILLKSIGIMKETIKEQSDNKSIATLTKSQFFHKTLLEKVGMSYFVSS